ncbi:MAG: hypothetical protein ACI9EZ_002243, partial [Halobacteriales archaeon]
RLWAIVLPGRSSEMNVLAAGNRTIGVAGRAVIRYLLSWPNTAFSLFPA